MACFSVHSLLASASLLLLLLVHPTVPVLHADSLPVKPLPSTLVKRMLTPTEVLAVVGDQTILAGDILPTIDQALQDAAEQIPSHQLDQQRAIYVRQLLPRKVESKLVLLDFYRTIPRDRLDEALAHIDNQVEEQFYQEQVPRLKKQLDVNSLRELDNKLRSFGTSIDLQKASFREQVIVQTTISQNVEQTAEITHDELLAYYHEHIEDYTVTAQAEWEKLTVRFDKFPSKSEADRALVEMGNQVLRGADFAAVAKKYSQGTNAWKGGYHDWTPQGSLVSEVLDQAIFSLPLNRLSKKLEDERGLHIVRVLARREAGRIPFEEAQGQIREELQDKRREQQTREYLQELREKTYIRTIFDEVSGVNASRVEK